MYLAPIHDMKVGEERQTSGCGYYEVGQVLHDDDPHFGLVLKVIAVGEDKGVGLDSRTVITVKRIERSPEGEAAIKKYRDRFWNPVRIVGDKLVVNGNVEMVEIEVCLLHKNILQYHPPLPFVQEPVPDFKGHTNLISEIPADGWYEVFAMTSLDGSELVIFEIKDQKIAFCKNVRRQEELDLRSKYGKE